MAGVTWTEVPVDKKDEVTWTEIDDSAIENADEKPWYDVSIEGMGRSAIDAIPVVTGIGGGIAGAGAGTLATPGIGTAVGGVGGAGLGYAFGKEMADDLKTKFFGDKPKEGAPIEALKRMGKNVADGAAMEMGGQAIGAVAKGGLTKAQKAARYMAEKGKSVGKSIYKSGLKNMDIVAERYGKEPVSDLLMSKGITGSSKQIQKEMDALGNTLLAERNEILKGATRKGAEVDVKAAVKSAQNYIAELRKINNPESHRVADMLQGRVDDYLGAAAKEGEPLLRSLPYTREADELVPQSELLGYRANSEKALNEVAPGDYIGQKFHERQLYTPVKGVSQKVSEPVLNEAGSGFQTGLKGWTQSAGDDIIGLPRQMASQKVLKPASDTALDFGVLTKNGIVDRVAGPTPIQTTSWKTTSADKVGDAAWQQIAQSAEGKGFDKALSGGLRDATEGAVGKALGDDAGALLKQKNADLGRILTTKERALLDAEQEARKNAVTSVDGMLTTNPAILAAKKLADFSKTTRARTVGGKAIMDASERVAQMLKQSPRFERMSRENPKAFSALVANMGQRMSSGAGEVSKAAQFDPTKPGDDEKSKQSFLEGN